MIQYPLKFQTHAKSKSGIQTIWTTEASPDLPAVLVAIPPEFEGPGGGYSPEDLFSFALQNCFVATFKVFAEKSRLSFESISVNSTLEVDRDATGKPWMARCHLRVALWGVSQNELAQRLLDRTSQSCMILNSVRTEKTFEWSIKSQTNPD